jgi:hypothetical protein
MQSGRMFALVVFLLGMRALYDHEQMTVTTQLCLIPVSGVHSPSGRSANRLGGGATSNKLRSECFASVSPYHALTARSIGCGMLRDHGVVGSAFSVSRWGFLRIAVCE